MKRKKIVRVAVYAALILIVIAFLSPLGLMVLNAFKGYDEIMRDVIAPPESFSFENFQTVFENMQYPRVFLNTLILTALSVGGIILLGALAGYKMSKTKTRYSKLLFFLCIVPMMIPFHSFMISLVKIATQLGITKSIFGLAIIYWGLGSPMAIFLFHGFSKTIPKEIEESALLDGCGQARMFFSIIFPLLKPVSASAGVVNAMWIWNDFLLPLLIIGGERNAQTLQLTAYKFMGQYKMEWQNIMASAILIILPALVIYLIFQRQIVKGMVTGSVKG